MKITSRAEAKEAGLPRYFTGKPCGKGHVTERFLSGGVCCECNRDRNRNSGRKENMTPEAYARYKERVNLHDHKRQAQKLGGGGELSPRIKRTLYEAQKGQCVYCRISLDDVTPHLDHIMPLALGGSNTDDNVQLLCATCNTRKGSAHPAEYEARIGRVRQNTGKGAP